MFSQLDLLLFSPKKKRKYSTSSNETICEGIEFPVEPDVANRSPLKDLSSQYNCERKMTCLACKNGDVASGSHTCIICRKNIHLLKGCSASIEEEEGHGERRICTSCSASSTKNARIALNEVENWRNLGQTKKKSRSVYLTKNHDLIDIITSSKCRTLPILKNGNDPSLRFVTLRKAKLSLLNTCPLDSLFQIILSGITDSEKLRKFSEDHKSTNALFEMALEVADKRVQLKTYQKRAEIFVNYLNKELNEDTIESIECSCNVVSLANFLFKNTPSFQEISVCRAGCQPLIKILPTITISGKEIDKPLEQVIKDHVALPSVPCRKSNCTEQVDNQIHKAGILILKNKYLKNY